jgi:hypothetical protein
MYKNKNVYFHYLYTRSYEVTEFETLTRDCLKDMFIVNMSYK